ncbi:hypothetical protein V2J09_017176 [Rumex salicifolius]
MSQPSAFLPPMTLNMWKFKPFLPKEPTGLEGRCIDIGNIKVQVKNAIAEGGFSYVYLARDAVNASKQYALKHMICNDHESLELVKKEISVMKSLRGHPNVVTLYSHTILDMGRTKEAFLVMEFCEKSLVSVLESRGSGYFEEGQVLSIFRDVCNAVFAMHCQSPPVAHRDLKAENLLLGSDGLWKLCDFGSTSINHRRFVKPEEMGIEEDIIRKHTTPAYRAPEMWDLLRRDLISEKVDIWALGCLLFRICYFKSAFDGESKLQILNGNYRIPDAPKYSTAIIELIRDMLQSTPEDRPDITQVWFRVNQQLPTGIQKSLPDQPPEMCQGTPSMHEGGISKLTAKAPEAHRRSPTPPVSTESTKKVSPSHVSKSGARGTAGSFWSTSHSQDSSVGEDKSGPKFDQETHAYSSSKQDRTYLEQQHLTGRTSPSREEHIRAYPSHKTAPRESLPRPDKNAVFQDEAFNTFVAEFDTSKLNSSSSSNNSRKESLEAEVERLKELLKQANLEKSEISSKYEKLSAICRSQRQEIMELKHGLAKNQSSPGTVTSQTDSAVQRGFLDRDSANTESKQWQAFSDDSTPQPLKNNAPQSVRTRNGDPKKQTSGDGKWGFETDSFTAVPSSTSQIPRTGEKQQSWNSYKGETKAASQPAGWADAATANRASLLLLQPGINTERVERVVTPRDNPAHVIILEILEADRALPGKGRVAVVPFVAHERHEAQLPLSFSEPLFSRLPCPLPLGRGHCLMRSRGRLCLWVGVPVAVVSVCAWGECVTSGEMVDQLAEEVAKC